MMVTVRATTILTPTAPEPKHGLTLVVGYLAGRRHLPVVEIRRAA